MRYTQLPTGKYASVAQYAKAHRVSRIAVHQWIEKGKVQAYWIGDTRIIKA